MMRYSADRACASRSSLRASTEAVRDNVEAPLAEHMMIELRFWKSYTPKGEEKRAVPEVGKTWFGPAQ